MQTWKLEQSERERSFPSVTCASCNKGFRVHIEKLQSLRAKAKMPLCRDCLGHQLQSRRQRPIVQARFLVEIDGKRLDDKDRQRLGLERATIYKTLAPTGVRVGELREVILSDMDLEQGWLNIRARVAKNSENADIPLRPDLVTDLRRWRQECSKPADDAGVFKVPRDSCRILKKNLEFAGIPYKTKHGYLDVHSLRHTTGTRLTNDPRVPARTAQAFMRHSDSKLTTQTYTDKRFVDLRVALDALPDIPLDAEDKQEHTMRATGTDDQTANSAQHSEPCKAECKACKAPCKAENLTSNGISLTPNDPSQSADRNGKVKKGEDVSRCKKERLASDGMEKGTADRDASPITPKGTRTPVMPRL